MKLFTIKSPTNWSPVTDRAEYLVRFPEDTVPELEARRHIAHSLSTLNFVLESILKYLLEQEGIQARVSWSSLDVADKCALLGWAFGQASHRGTAYQLRMQSHIAAVEHYDRERSRLLRAEFRCPGSLTLVEMADLADTLMAAALELEAGIASEHPDFACALYGMPRAEAA